jgi:hypothetical protein
MRGRAREVVRRRDRFVEAIDRLDTLVKDAAAFRGGAWSSAAWKVDAFFEMLAVRANTEWESFAHDLLILELARDTTALAAETQLRIPPKVSFDLAEALLTARGYLEFRDVGQLRGQAKKWLVESPFEKLLPVDRDAMDDLRTIRNFIVHRSRQSEQTYAKLLAKRGQPHALPGSFLLKGIPSRLETYLATLTAAAGRLI